MAYHYVAVPTNEEENGKPCPEDANIGSDLIQDSLFPQDGEAGGSSAQSGSHGHAHQAFVRLAPVLITLVFFGVGVIAYQPIEGWSWAESLLFSVEVLSAVGWGTVVPETDAGKLFTTAYCFAAMLILFYAISTMMNILVESALDDVLDAIENKVSNVTDTDSPWANFRQRCYMVVIVNVTAFLFFWKVDGMEPVDSVYFCVVSMTTIGFGDVFPSTVSGKVFAACWIFLTVSMSASCLHAFAHARAAHTGGLKIASQLKLQDLKSMDASGDGKVDRYEFFLHVLTESNMVTTEDISHINSSFDEFDVDKSGTLDLADLQSAFSQVMSRQKN